jgi:hypothetical protein
MGMETGHYVQLPYLRSPTKLIGLVNGNIVTFYGFADSDGNQQTGRIISAPTYMLVMVPDSKVKIGDFRVGVVPLKRSKISFQAPRESMGATYEQFGVTLAYAITDYKCQGETYHDGLLTDLQWPLIGNTEAASLYVQLSRVQSLHGSEASEQYEWNVQRRNGRIGGHKRLTISSQNIYSLFPFREHLQL